jgi:hypothetical protein
LDNAEGVGPQGRGQDARVNRRDARERRSKDDVEKAMEGFFNNLLIAKCIRKHACNMYCLST